MKLSNTKLIGLLLSVLLTSVIVGHFFAPAGILLSPIVMVTFAGLILFTKNELSIVFKAILVYLVIGLNDIGIKLWSGGIHDTEGMGWIHMLLFVGSAISFIMLVLYAFKNDTTSVLGNTVGVLIFPALIFVHLFLFEKLGATI